MEITAVNISTRVVKYRVGEEMGNYLLVCNQVSRTSRGIKKAHKTSRRFSFIDYAKIQDLAPDVR